MRPFLLIASLGCVLTFVVGCGKDNPLGRLPVSGKITLGGQPLDQGDIEFAPVDAQGKTKAGAPVKDGEFSIPTESGLVPGTYVVRLFSSSAGSAAAKDAMPGTRQTQVARERIPPQYNVRSTLRFEVKAREDNVFNLDL